MSVRHSNQIQSCSSPTLVGMMDGGVGDEGGGGGGDDYGVVAVLLMVLVSRTARLELNPRFGANLRNSERDYACVFSVSVVRVDAGVHHFHGGHAWCLFSFIGEQSISPLGRADYPLFFKRPY